MKQKNVDRFCISWNDINLLLEILAKKMPKQAEIYGVPRNGVILAAMLVHVNEELKLVMSPTPGCIIVDDIYDTGKTLQAYEKEGYTTAALYYRYGNLKHPTFWAELVENDDWLVFPWEKK